jgi:hypothetical protein
MGMDVNETGSERKTGTIDDFVGVTLRAIAD